MDPAISQGRDIGTALASAVEQEATMGIRFKCPNGHKINVKAFLAGKKARCPDCGERVVVPFESETAESLGATVAALAEDKLLAENAPALTTAAPVAAHAAVPAPARDAKPAAPITAAPVAAVLTPVTPAAPFAPPPPARPDPIAEAPLAVWYVRPRAGGQFGPAPGDIFRQWITEKRVAADSLVWRDGWPEWRLASESLPQFSSRPPAPAAATGFMAPAAVAPVFAGNGPASPAMTQASATESPAMAASAKYLRSRKSRTPTIVAICSLAVVAIALIAVLIYVLNK